VEEDVRVSPLAAFADHGVGAAGEALAIALRPGNAGSNTASEHIEVIRQAVGSAACPAGSGAAVGEWDAAEPSWT